MAMLAASKGASICSERLGTTFFCGEQRLASTYSGKQHVVHMPAIVYCSSSMEAEKGLKSARRRVPALSEVRQERSSPSTSASCLAPPICRTRGSCSSSPSLVAAVGRSTGLLEQTEVEIDRSHGATSQDDGGPGRKWWLSAETAVRSAFDRSKLEVQWALTLSDPLPKVARDMSLGRDLLGLDGLHREEAPILSPKPAVTTQPPVPGVKLKPRVLNTKSAVPIADGKQGCNELSARQRRLQARLKKVIEVELPKRSSTHLQKEPGGIHLLLEKQAKARNMDDALGPYLQRAGRVKLLTKDEEGFLARRLGMYRDLTDIKRRSKKQTGREPLAPEWAAAADIPVYLLQQRIRDGQRARRRLLTANVRLVVSVARNYTNFGLELADLVQAGNLGLLRGIERFDPGRGYKLSTYVHWWIRAAISKSLAESGQLLRLPLHVHETMCRVKKAQAKLLAERKQPSLEELSRELDMSERRLSNAMASVCRIRSLDSTISKRGSFAPGTSLYNFVPDSRSEREMWNLLEDRCLKQEVDQLLSKLDSRQRNVLHTHYGFDRSDCVTLSFDDIKHRFGISRERVRQLETAALCKLRMVSKSKQLECYLRR